MKIRIFLVLVGLLFSTANIAQRTDTISRNLKRPPVLDLLGTKKQGGIVQNSQPLGRGSANRNAQPTTSRKTVSKSAPREKTILTRALREFVPEDQFNLSVVRDEIYEITEYPV